MVRVRSLGPQTTLGEMGLISRQGRSATIQAEIPSVLYLLSAEAYECIKRDNGPLAQALLSYVIAILAERLSFASRAIGVCAPLRKSDRNAGSIKATTRKSCGGVMWHKKEQKGEVIELLFELFTMASKRRGELQSKWIGVLSRLAGEYDSIGVLRLQSDHRIDLVLRAIEDEIVSRGFIASAASDSELISLDFLTALTRYWLFSSYEALKVAKKSEKGKLDSKLQSVYQRFRLVWLSFAKSESSYGMLRSQREVGYYRPVGTFNRRTGSLGWRVANPAKGSEETIFRRELSDELLTLFD